MNESPDTNRWPADVLPPAVPPPPALEDRVVARLRSRGLLRARPATPMRLGLALAASVVLLATGVVIGRLTVSPAPAGALTGAATDLYAVLLYETEGYDPPSPAEALGRYREYGLWVAEALRREQFVAGEDLEVERGWLLTPTAAGGEVRVATSVATSVAEGAPLSGLFFIRARDPEEALALARSLPHLRHGGQVLVQKTIPTDTPPQAP